MSFFKHPPARSLLGHITSPWYNMKFDASVKFQSIVARIQMPRVSPPCCYAVDFDWEDLKWWQGQGVFDDIDRYAVVSRHISELHKIIYHTICFPGKILKGYAADVTLCCPHVVPLTAISLLVHQAEQEWRALLRKINKPYLAKIFRAWNVTKMSKFDFQ